jgi:hypothetical protein
VVPCQKRQQVELTLLEANGSVANPHFSSTTIEGKAIEQQDFAVGRWATVARRPDHTRFDPNHFAFTVRMTDGRHCRPS